MSRHRDIRNLNIKDELDDDALSDGGEEDMTEEQHARLIHGLEQVRQILGDDEVSGFSDKELMDALWEYYFDEEKTVQWALEEQHKRDLARERRDPLSEKGVPPVPLREVEGPSNVEYYYPEEYQYQGQLGLTERSRTPLVFLHQQQGSMEMSEIGTPQVRRPALSTITEHTERTERTEPTPRAIGRSLSTHQTRRKPSTSYTSSSYGDVIKRGDQAMDTLAPADPNLIPVSPPVSALHPLSDYLPATPTVHSGLASPPSAQAYAPSETVLLGEGLPEILEHSPQSSKSGHPPTPPPKQSKLALLAHSRAGSNSSRSESSRSSRPLTLGSVRTFSAHPPSRSNVLVNPTAPSDPALPRSSSDRPGENESYLNPPSSDTNSASMKSHVRRAIATAMKLEAEQQANLTEPKRESSPSQESHGSFAAGVPQVQGRLLPPTQSPGGQPIQTNIASHSYKEVDMFRSPSKLALLAQANKLANKGSKIKKPVTEYLTPTANGPTATTAITTSYQTIYTLTDPTRSREIPALNVVPLNATPPQGVKGSKLAAKLQRAHERHRTPPPIEKTVPPITPMFNPKSSAVLRASPSTFASLLVDDSLTFEDKNHSSHHRNNELKDKTGVSIPAVSSLERQKREPRKHRQHGPVMPELSGSSSFKFDGPSPDDIVFNARRGTSLAQKSSSLLGVSRAVPSVK